MIYGFMDISDISAMELKFLVDYGYGLDMESISADEMDYEPISNHSCCNTAPCTSKPLHNIKYDIWKILPNLPLRGLTPFAKRLR